MPLAGDLTFEAKSAKTNYGLRINFADTQDRFDSKVLDVGQTSGYTVFDVFAGFEPSPNLRLTIVKCLSFDRFGFPTCLIIAVLLFLATNNLDGAADRTDEPGRTLFGSINYDF